MVDYARQIIVKKFGKYGEYGSFDKYGEYGSFEQ